MILHIETSSRACSIALSQNGAIEYQQTLTEKYAHSGALVPMIAEGLGLVGLTPAELDAVAVSMGPGSYTGLRVGLSTAKGICYANGIPLIGIDTLESIADMARAGQPGYDTYVGALDARRMDAYIAIFDGTGRRMGPNEFVTVDSELIRRLAGDSGRVMVCGEGTERWREVAGSVLELNEVACDATNMVRLATQSFENQVFEDLASSVPTYVKAPNITTPA